MDNSYTITSSPPQRLLPTRHSNRSDPCPLAPTQPSGFLNTTTDPTFGPPLTLSEFMSTVDSLTSKHQNVRSVFHQPLYLDWASQLISLKSSYITYKVSHFWDYLCLQGQPFKPLCMHSTTMFDQVRFSMSQWSLPYNNTRYTDFATSNIAQSIHVATSAGMQWYMMFIDSDYTVDSRHLNRFSQTRVQELHNLFIHVFETTEELFQYGIMHQTPAAKLPIGTSHQSIGPCSKPNCSISGRVIGFP